MKTIKFTTSSQTKKLLKQLAGKSYQVKIALKKAGYDFGKAVTDDIRHEMTHGAKTGRRYLIYRGRGGRKLSKPRFHTASARGDTAPAVISGGLRSSVDFRVKSYKQVVIGAGNSEINYAKFVEGRPHKRYFLKRGIRRNIQKGKSFVIKRLGGVMK